MFSFISNSYRILEEITQAMSAAQILEAVATVVLSSFFVVITFSFFKYRLVRKQEELNSLLADLKLSTHSKKLNTHLATEFSKGDYILPLAFVTIVSFLGIFLLLLGWSLYDPEPNGFIKSMIWSGSDFWNDPIYGNEKKSLSIVAWALFGSFLSGAQYIYRRFSTIDLTPGNFFSTGIRMIMAPVIALMTAYVIGWEEPAIDNENLIIVISFLIGLFPERGLKTLIDKTGHIFPFSKSKEADNIPLEAIEGVSYMHRLRLNELGIDNVQNLSQYNFLLLIVKTPFPVRILLDWVSQAKLMMEFHNHCDALAKAGIRSALDFVDAVSTHEDAIQRISKLKEIEPLVLEINLKNLEEDKSLQLLEHFKTNIEQVKID